MDDPAQSMDGAAPARVERLLDDPEPPDLGRIDRELAQDARADLRLGLADRGVRGLLASDCLDGRCRERTEQELAAPLSVPALAIYSRDDGVVGWQSCQDPAAEWVEVDSSHNGYGTDPAVYTAVAARLAIWTANS